jgi:ABC-2 type transport system permease protein
MPKVAKNRNIVQLIIAISTIIIVSYISTLIYLRIDLTSEKRFTLSSVTKNTLKDLNDIVYVKIYLDGDMPIGFQRMQKSLKETLNEFRIYAGENVQYEFINPAESTNPKVRDAVFKDLFDKGLVPTNIQVRDKEGGNIQKLLYPGALLSYKGKEIPINLLHNNPALTGDENINLSIQNFEFNFIDAIVKLRVEKLPKLAFILGHGELDQYETGDIDKSLSEYFDTYRVEINGDIKALDPYKVVIIAGPKQPVPEADKVVIDQYIMRGGKVLWFVDPVAVSIDSLSQGSSTLAYMNQLNLDDQLFKYGVRLNPALIQDLQCAIIPVNASLPGQEARFVPSPWLYYPLLSSSESSPITRNLNMTKAQFISPLDTVGGNKEVKKTILLRSSPYSKILNVPLFVNLAEVNKTPNDREFTHSNIPVAVLLEGKFESVFENRPLSKYNHGQPFDFKQISPNTRMIVVADADIIRNDVRRRPKGAFVSPLGYDRYSKQTFGNKDLVMNMVKYLDDDIGLMNLRTRDFKLRMLDKQKINESKFFWQSFNLFVPSAIFVLGGLIWLYFRKKRFTK